jgi:adenylylsulfate kinase-like enzyme
MGVKAVTVWCTGRSGVGLRAVAEKGVQSLAGKGVQQ